VYVAGRHSWRISIDEPPVLRLALYLREIYQLPARTDPEIPALDPPASAWPAWSRRPPPLEPMQLTSIEREAASIQWARWWKHAVQVGSSAMRELTPPSFKSFSHVPELRALLVRHYTQALLWADAFADDPRLKRDHLAPGTRLTELVHELESAAGRTARPFELRITVIPVRTKHAWILDPGHLLITHHLIADDENVLDWLRPKIRALV
jgi:hypothetical protein